MSTMDIAEHTCKICGAEFKDSSMHADICKECAEETNRCEFCGKKLSEEIKASSEEKKTLSEEEKKLLEEKKQLLGKTEAFSKLIEDKKYLEELTSKESFNFTLDDILKIYSLFSYLCSRSDLEDKNIFNNYSKSFNKATKSFISDVEKLYQNCCNFLGINYINNPGPSNDALKPEFKGSKKEEVYKYRKTSKLEKDNKHIVRKKNLDCYVDSKNIFDLIESLLSNVSNSKYSTYLKKLKNDISIIESTSYADMKSLIHENTPDSMIKDSKKSDPSEISADEKFNLIKELYRIDYVDDYERAIKRTLKDIFGAKDPEELTLDEKEMVMSLLNLFRATTASSVRYSYGNDFKTIRKVIMELKKYKNDDDDYDSHSYGNEKGYAKYLNNKNGPSCYDFFARLFGILYNKKPEEFKINDTDKKMLDAYLCKIDSDPYAKAIEKNKNNSYGDLNICLSELKKYTINFSENVNDNKNIKDFIVCITNFESYFEKNKKLDYKIILSKREEIDKLIGSLCPDKKGDVKELMVEFLKDKKYFDKENTLNGGVLLSNSTSV